MQEIKDHVELVPFGFPGELTIESIALTGRTFIGRNLDHGAQWREGWIFPIVPQNDPTAFKEITIPFRSLVQIGDELSPRIAQKKNMHALKMVPKPVDPEIGPHTSKDRT